MVRWKNRGVGGTACAGNGRAKIPAKSRETVNRRQIQARKFSLFAKNFVSFAYPIRSSLLRFRDRDAFSATQRLSFSKEREQQSRHSPYTEANQCR